MYAALAQHCPSTGALIGQALALALALAETGDVASGLAVLNAVQAQRTNAATMAREAKALFLAEEEASG